VYYESENHTGSVIRQRARNSSLGRIQAKPGQVPVTPVPRMKQEGSANALAPEHAEADRPMTIRAPGLGTRLLPTGDDLRMREPVTITGTRRVQHVTGTHGVDQRI